MSSRLADAIAVLWVIDNQRAGECQLECKTLTLGLPRVLLAEISSFRSGQRTGLGCPQGL
jgi:hypothetical protein